MKKSLNAILSMFLMLSTTSCAQTNTGDDKSAQSKSVVVYFSATGTTKSAAELIAKAKNAMLAEICPVEPYTSDDLNWHDKQSRSSVEMNDDNARPAIKPMEVNFDKYDTIFLGYPIWWDMATRAVNTFIEKAALKGKTVIPFATSGGSTIDNSVSRLKKQYPDINWAEGRLLNGASQEDVDQWVGSLAK